ncbi:hypothetical protein BO94DRAFT_573899 [Aspergillus sclerotioniger CBS 115572]|uniref:5'-3' DNA helicase ZGRF1-like N-terminal domain-containing protein n=1 Tax=Aspergillus sclerotioniger CBS 115572 TaxID=1450535 RepID=A0A317X4I4_9EURO|nr:hypothetical protein BO94DRAFT_573899 [Aspergillus sclerotioniger CBS 115572]PWY91470.1 hypothetical protein BO94DRAFT_573899 [Aspergillus sclerotioniger CBS 115572]
MSTPRGTPSMSVPATQNTAPVIRFRCLYTYDMRRKAKRWQDGFLRYHTFNKRIMTYDVAGNFVGDYHWRQDDEGIQDGDELELDNGALIQVCEPVERTETDISALYSNKRTSHRSPSRPGETPTPSVTPSRPSLSSQPTRSLNDLLGIKKTPAQRTDLPNVDRERPTLRGNEHGRSERPAKRQRTKLTSADSPPKQTASHRTHREQAIIDLTESDTTERQVTSHGSALDNVVDLGVKDSKNIATPANPRRKSTHRADQAKCKKAEKSTSDPPEQVRPRTLGHPNDDESPEVPGNMLRLPTGKSRKKMMYQAVVASQDANADPERHSEPGDHSNDPHSDLEDGPPISRKRKTDPVGLRKSYSDPTALFSHDDLPSRHRSSESPLSTITDTDESETGPWTWEAETSKADLNLGTASSQRMKWADVLAMRTSSGMATMMILKVIDVW